jgi:hypothetical protein
MLRKTCRITAALWVLSACREASGPERLPLAVAVSDVVVDTVCCSYSTPVMLSDGPTGIFLLYGYDELRLAQCAAGCTDPAHWNTAPVLQGGVDEIAATLTRTGLHVLFGVQKIQGALSGSLRYAECQAACADSSSWSRSVLDSGETGGYPVLAVGSGDRLDAFYSQIQAPFAWHYAECLQDCATATNWSSVVLDSSGVGYSPEGAWLSALRVEPAGRVHALVHSWPGELRYAECDGDCTNLSSWTRTVLADSVWSPTLAMGPDGTVHAAYTANRFGSPTPQGSVHYGQCRSGCTVLTNWRLIAVPGLDSAWAAAVAVDAFGRVHLGASAGPPWSSLLYARCDSGCGSPTAWRTARLAIPVYTMAWDTDEAGTVRVAYATSGRLHYAEVR